MPLEHLPKKPNIVLIITDQEREVMHWPEGWAEANLPARSRLMEHGLRVGVLSPSVSPRRRVAWIQRHAPAIDVLLTNARLVKVGLNLRMFATGIFFEFEWSLAILWQAMRRVYRPGAPLPL